MKINNLIILAVSAMICACQKGGVQESVQEDTVIQATIENVVSTKTVMDEDNNILWSEGDQVIAFMKSSLGSRYQIKETGVGKASGDFFKVSGSDDLGTEIVFKHNIVYYPYSSITAEETGSDYALRIVLPLKQTYEEDSFGNGAMPMVAVSENNDIAFNNVLGGMKLQLKGAVKVASVMIEGKGSEKLSGAAVVTAYPDGNKPKIAMSEDATEYVVLDCGDGVQLNESTSTEFIITLPPVLFSRGFMVTVTDDLGQTYTFGTDKKNEVVRSSILVMPEVTLENSAQEDPDGLWVDLGLSVLWAKYNVGATSAEDYGGYYGWGETEEKGIYTWQSYKFYDYWSDSFTYIGYEISGTQYDVASVKWGDGARMPTLDEVSELIEKCTFKAKTINNIKGADVMGPNGNHIFLPNTGFRGPMSGNNVSDDGGFGYYWTGSHTRDAYMDAYCITGNSGGYWTRYDGRHYGKAVRPVKDK